MPQLDFREALSTPDEKLFVQQPVAASSAPEPGPENRMSNFANAVRLSRPTWTNIVFVALASLGGLFSAFYFFNGAEVLRAAAWPGEFLYPHSVSAEKIDAKVQPNPTAPTNEPVAPAGPVVPPLPIIVPPVFPPLPPPSVLDDLNAILNGTASGANELAQSDLPEVCPASDLAARLQAV